LYQSTSPEKFATLFYAILDTKTHQIHYSNAGQDNPYLLSGQSEIKRLKTGGIPLGMLPDFGFEEESVPLEDDCTLIVYSDGVTEAMNSEEEQFGDDRIAAVFDKCKHASPSEIIDQLVAAVKNHAAGYPQSDDITVVVMRRKKN
jgi:sigma-B regulation protein RsbU (phosphoserine phosphatase)